MAHCSAAQQQCNTNLLNEIGSYPQFAIPIRNTDKLNCPVADPYHINHQFWLYSAKLPPILDYYVSFKNSDVTYLYWCDYTR